MLKVKDVVDYYWSIPINLHELAKFFEKAKTKKDLEYIIFTLKEQIKCIENSFKFIEEDSK